MQIFFLILRYNRHTTISALSHIVFPQLALQISILTITKQQCDKSGSTVILNLTNYSNNCKVTTKNKFRIYYVLQEVAENGADTAHLSAVHGPIIFSNFIYPFSCIARHSWTNVGWRPHNLFSESKSSDGDEPKKQSSENLSHRAYTTLKHSLVLFKKYKLLNLDVHVQQIGPGYVELTMDTYFGRMCIFQTVTPMEPLLQKVPYFN